MVADTEEEARRLALPNQLMMLALRTGQPLGPQLLVEEAEAVELPAQHRELVDTMAARWVVGDPGQAASALAGLAASYEVDEVMLHPVAGAYAGTDARSAPTREATLRLAADWVLAGR